MVKKLPDAHAVRLQTKAVPRVAILLDTAHEFGREVIRGIGNFSLLSESWFLDVIDPALPQRRLAASLSRCDGAIGRVETTAMFRFISRNKLPFVCLISAVAEAEELVGTNQAILCRLALGHMRERGFRELAFYGRHLRHGRVRFKILERIAPEFDCQITSLRIGAVMTPEVLVPQLAKLPIPAGVICSDDCTARSLLDAAHAAGVQVPESLAVLGFDNDSLFCELAYPKLSSVALDCFQIGFEAARMLSRWFEGQPPSGRIEVAPRGVRPRASTDTSACSDAVVREAVGIIRQSWKDGISVSEIARRVCVSRRSLQQRFAASLGRSPRLEIERTRLAHALDLLRHTDIKLIIIARQCGFCSTEHMHRVIRRKLGASATEIRARWRGTPPL